MSFSGKSLGKSNQKTSDSNHHSILATFKGFFKKLSVNPCYSRPYLYSVLLCTNSFTSRQFLKFLENMKTCLEE